MGCSGVKNEDRMGGRKMSEMAAAFGCSGSEGPLHELALEDERPKWLLSFS
jgi:hypothetical protein